VYWATGLRTSSVAYLKMSVHAQKGSASYASRTLLLGAFTCAP
jgi:hypothetical protein